MGLKVYLDTACTKPAEPLLQLTDTDAITPNRSQYQLPSAITNFVGVYIDSIGAFMTPPNAYVTGSVLYVVIPPPFSVPAGSILTVITDDTPVAIATSDTLNVLVNGTGTIWVGHEAGTPAVTGAVVLGIGVDALIQELPQTSAVTFGVSPDAGWDPALTTVTGIDPSCIWGNDCTNYIALLNNRFIGYVLNYNMADKIQLDRVVDHVWSAGDELWLIQPVPTFKLALDSDPTNFQSCVSLPTLDDANPSCKVLLQLPPQQITADKVYNPGLGYAVIY